MTSTGNALLVFDLDGTLSDPAVGIGRSINHALAHYGYPTIPEAQVPQFIGPPLDTSFGALTGSTDPGHLAELVAKYRERYADVGYAENILYPGIPEALETLAAAGVSMGLCTSKRVDFAQSILKLFGLEQHFRFLSGGDIGVHKRQQLASLLSVGSIQPTSIMIGDRAIDISAAKSNGLRPIGVLWGHGSAEELTRADPDALVRFPRELVDLRYVV